MKKVMTALLIAVVLVAFISVFAGPSSAADQKKYKFRYSSNLSSIGWGPVHTVKPWFKQVEKATNGQVAFEPYWAASLAKSPAVWGALKKGIADVGEVGFHYTRGLVVLHNVITLPFLEYQSAEHESIVAWKLYEKFPEIRNEYKDNKVLLFFCSTPFFFVSGKKQLKSREDFKGLKIRVVGGESLQFMVESGGGIPTRVAGSEIYSALEKGVIDATVTNWDMLVSYRLYEVAKYAFFGPFNAGARGACMSHQAWNSLTPDLQQKMMSVCGLEGSRFWARTTYDESVKHGREKVKSEGYELIETTLSPEKTKEWKDLYREKAWNAWIKMAVKDAKSHGYPEPEALVKKLISSTQELIETTRK